MKNSIIVAITFSVLLLSCKKTNLESTTEENQISNALTNIKANAGNDLTGFYANGFHEIKNNTLNHTSLLGVEQNLIARPKFRFRWDGCDRPLGVCLVFSSFSASANPADISVDDGFATIQVKDGRLHVILHKQAALSNGLIPISESGSLGPILSKQLGYDEIVIKSGVYQQIVNTDNSINPIYQPYFGETDLDIIVR